MNTIILEADIKVAYVTAKSFPKGITEAFEKLDSIVPSANNRRHFGISQPNKNNVIIYKAAVEEQHKGEAEKFGLESFVIQKGQYIYKDILNYSEKPQNISDTFRQLISQPNIDPDGYCLEWYLNESDVRCMVRIV